MWRFEDAFSQPFLTAGARLVDRATMMRLTAAAHKQTAYEDQPVKRIKTEALCGNADILAEIRIGQEPHQRLGYVFHVKAVDLKSGEVLASTISTSRGKGRRAPNEWIATPEGYQRTGLPKPAVVGRYLAEDLMDALTPMLK